MILPWYLKDKFQTNKFIYNKTKKCHINSLVWSSAAPLLGYLEKEVFSQYLLKKRESGENKELNILELGSGTGILGLCVAALGHNVILTDPGIDVNLSEDKTSTTLEHLKLNVARNIDIVGQQYDYILIQKYLLHIILSLVSILIFKFRCFYIILCLHFVLQGKCGNSFVGKWWANQLYQK